MLKTYNILIIIQNSNHKAHKRNITKMYTIVYKPSTTKLITIIILCIIVLGCLCQFISLRFYHSNIVSGIVVCLGVVAVVRAVGFFVMYPGTYRYLTAQIQKNQNDFLLTAIHRDLTALQGICTHILTKNLPSLKNRYLKLSGQQLPDSFRTQLNILIKSETKSKAKLQLIQTYLELIKCLELKINITQQKCTVLPNKQLQNWISIQKILTNPSLIVLVDNQIDFLCFKQATHTCRSLCSKIWELCTTFAKIEQHFFQDDPISDEISSLNLQKQEKSPPIKVGKSKVAHWLLHKQKLFTVDSYYAHWDKHFTYSLFKVRVQNGNYIECAIIHKQKSKKIDPPKQGILFNNPNGTIIQSFALNSPYMNFYLKMGLQIVMWNYRGYANSTGFATVKNCISDAEAVYRYASKTYGIRIKILHGYSIGGIAAISLAKKLNSRPAKPIKLLVTDRTLSSIDQVAVGFAHNIQSCACFLTAIAQHFVKIFFHSECIDNTKLFLACQCDKVIIYDTNDEVIRNEASLKYSIQKYAISKQKVHGSFNQYQFKQCVSNFANTMYNLYKQNQKLYEKVMRILNDMDGGGRFPNLQMNLELQNGKKTFSRQKIIRQCQQYFTGLIMYGPKLCLPYFSNSEQQQKLVQSKIERKIKTLEQLKQKQQQNQLGVKKQVSNIIQSLIYAKSQLTLDKMKQKNKIFGSLIATEVGHNNDLKQWWPLERILKISLSDQNISKN